MIRNAGFGCRSSACVGRGEVYSMKSLTGDNERDNLAAVRLDPLPLAEKNADEQSPKSKNGVQKCQNV